MQRCSDTIGTIAAALANAQGELANPEKTLTATIDSPFPREEKRTFRYASLAAGLDIVRKCLSRYEIATVQTTAIDAKAGLVSLTTVLAHSSGEWLSSEWPVCPVAETSAPHRMGAALTYARRYALFTLVGIAGEDDLDAPDLVAGPTKRSNGGGQLQNNGSPINGHQPSDTIQHKISLSERRTSRQSSAIRPPNDSTAARDRLIAEIASLQSADEAAAWAYQNLPTKNTLDDVDAQRVEGSFAARIATLETDNSIEITCKKDPTNDSTQAPFDKRHALPLGKTIRLRDKEHRRFVAKQACVVCGRSPSDAHHLRFAQPRALGRKVSDEYTVPLCRTHHRQLHRTGKEVTWWQANKIDPMPIARQLWEQTRAAASSSE